MLLIVAPLVVAAAHALNLSLIYLGVILTVNIELSVITPPLGVNLLTISAVTGMSAADATTLIVNGFFEPFVKELPMEYAVELNRLLAVQMEGAVG